MSAVVEHGQIGRPRKVGTTIVLVLVTLGIYGLYWLYASFSDIRRYRGQGVSGIVGVLLSFVAVATFLLPSYAGRLYQEDGQQPPITGWGGFWVFVPFVGSLIWLAKIQGALNRFWEHKSAPGAGPAPVALAPPVPEAAPRSAAASPSPPPPAPDPAAAPPAAAAPPPPTPGAAQPPVAVPSPAPTPALVFREGPLAGRRFPVETQLLLGRENTDVIVEDPEVSRQHALLRRAGEALEISDLRSANGTFVNGQRIGERGELHDGDIVKIGMTTIRIEIPAPSRDPDATVVSRR